MESKDLRIGNHVYLIAEGHEDEPDLVEWKLEDYDFYENKMEYIEPIPLTKEWLKKFFFKKEKSDIPTFSKVFGSFIEDDYEHCLIINLDADEIFYTVINGVKLILKHVHQLQNLYFAFTGEELNQHFDIIRKRISLVHNIKMSDEMFNEKADEFTHYLLEHFGFESIPKEIYLVSRRGEFWQLQYKK